MAYIIGTLKNSVNTGVRTTPPPSPANAPRMPATIPAAMNSNIFIKSKMRLIISQKFDFTIYKYYYTILYVS